MKIHRTSVDSKPESKPTAVLARQCERALVAAARSYHVSTRKRIHRAAREFIRRHARNRAYLAQVMKRVAVNAALAIALLGLGSQSAHATGAPVFDPFATNPFAGLDAGSFSTLAAGDLNGDGDPDFVASDSFATGQIRYYENTGTATAPILTERSGAANPFTGLVSSWTPLLALGDLDADGDLDLLCGNTYGGTLKYFENTGTAIAPAFVERTGAANPIAVVSGDRLAPALGDLDRDGDLDLAVGGPTGNFRFFRNTGSARLPAFNEITGPANPFDGLIAGPGFISNPALGDIDFDGDLDLVSGDEPTGGFHTFRNTGSPATPAFEPMAARSNPFAGESVGLNSTPVLIDLDADGDLDLAAGERNGGFRVYQNQTGGLAESEEINPEPLGFSSNYAIVGGDFDGDGDLGLFGSGCAFADNTGGATNPLFSSSSIPGFGGCAANIAPITVDIDADGDFDISTGADININGGTPTSPGFWSVTSLFPIKPGFRPPTATFGDLDGDGDEDAAAMYVDLPGTLVNRTYFENVGSPSVPSFVERTGGASPLPGSTYSRMVLADYDSDGDHDALEYPNISNDAELSVYWENVGTATSPSFRGRPTSDRRHPVGSFANSSGIGHVLNAMLGDFDGDGDADGFGVRVDVSTGGLVLDGVFLENSIVRPSPRYFGPIASPFTTQDAGSFSTIAAADLDGDGDPDFVASESFATGLIRYYENTGSALAPFAVERTGTENPFTGLVSTWTPILTLADLDSDGDFDLLCGQAYYGEPLKYFENTGTPTDPIFVERIGAANPVDILTGSRTAPALGDVDGDGDLDLVLGDATGTFRFVRNFGSAKVPAFDEITGPASPFDGLVAGVGFMSNPALGDVDLDGDLDLVSGDEPSGGFHYFENTGTATSPVYVSRTGVENPFDGESVGLNSTPALIDLDADGDLDLVSGERDGTFEAYYLPEPSKGLLLSAGIALLAWLRRGRD